MKNDTVNLKKNILHRWPLLVREVPHKKYLGLIEYFRVFVHQIVTCDPYDVFILENSRVFESINENPEL